MHKHNTLLEWCGSLLAVSGAILLAINIKISPWAFVLYLMSSIILGVWGIRRKAYGIAMQNMVFMVINIVGIYRWLL